MPPGAGMPPGGGGPPQGPGVPYLQMLAAQGKLPTPTPVNPNAPPSPMAKGGVIEEGDAPAKKGVKSVRRFGAKDKAAEDLPEAPAKKAKGGAIKHRKPKAPKKVAVAVPMTPGGDEDPGPPPNLQAIAGPGPGPAGPAPAPAGPPPPGMKKGGKAAHAHKKKAKAKKVERKNKGGECKMAAGGAMKVRRGFPNVNAAPKKKFANGGKVRGAGAATKGTRFAGIF